MSRARSYWLVKSEPFKYSWDDFVRDGSTYWDGVRNALARNHLQAMRRDDHVLYYHSNEGKEVVGVAKVTKTAYPDPTSDDARWVVVDLAPVRPLARPVTLAEIKADAKLRDIPLVRQSRLSVMPLPRAAFDRIVALGKAAAPAAAAQRAASAPGARSEAQPSEVAREGERSRKASAGPAGTRKPARRRTRSSAIRRAP